MDVILTAGGIPHEKEPLYPFTQGRPKALLDLAGQPMIQWVLDALGEAKQIERIVIVGLSEADRLVSRKPLTFIPNQGEMLENILAGAQKLLSLDPSIQLMMSVSSDVPALTGRILDWMVEQVGADGHDVYYNVVSRQAMESRFPGSKRTYTRFKDIEVCGGDVTVFRTSLLTTEESVWRELISARKNVFRQAAIIGFDTLLLLAARQLTLQGAVQRVARRLNINAKVLVNPYPEVAMDVDKPYQLEILRAELAQRRPA